MLAIDSTNPVSFEAGFCNSCWRPESNDFAENAGTLRRHDGFDRERFPRLRGSAPLRTRFLGRKECRGAGLGIFPLRFLFSLHWLARARDRE